jgi:hypothetical protein
MDAYLVLEDSTGVLGLVGLEFDSERPLAEFAEFTDAEGIRFARPATQFLTTSEDAVSVSLVFASEFVTAVSVSMPVAELLAGLVSEADCVLVVNFGVNHKFSDVLVDVHGEVVEQDTRLASTGLRADRLGGFVWRRNHHSRVDIVMLN